MIVYVKEYLNSFLKAEFSRTLSCDLIRDILSEMNPRWSVDTKLEWLSQFLPDCLNILPGNFLQFCHSFNLISPIQLGTRKVSVYTRVSLSLRTDNEAAFISVQEGRGGLVIHSVFSVQGGVSFSLLLKRPSADTEVLFMII
jgi:hypothetical protein